MTDLLPPDFHFVRPLWLLAMVPAVLLFFMLWFMRMRSSGWSKAIESSLLPHLLDSMPGKRQNWPLFAVLTAWLLSCLSLAGPVWEKLPQPVQKKENALVIVQDLSISFYAQDLSPSRLVRAQHKLTDLLKKRTEGTTALVVYSAGAHVVSPLTDDSKTIAAMIPALSPAIMPGYGSNAEEGVQQALRLLKDAGVSQGQILLLTDEVAEEDAAAITKLLQDKNISLLVLGAGTEEGGPIPASEGGFLKDDDGNIIIPQMNRDVLRKLAQNNNGRYLDIRLDDTDIDYLLAASPVLPREEAYRKVDREFDQWKEMGHWLLVLIVPAALFAFRRGWLLAVVLGLTLWSNESHALGWQDLWQRSDQQGAEALRNDDPGRAAELFQNPAWKGAARYQAGDYEAAAQQFAQNENADNLYNQGNALARAGKLDEALKAYERALQLAPDMEDAKFNKNLLEQLKQQQQQSQQGEGQDKKPDGQAGQQQEQNQQGQQSQNQDDQTQGQDDQQGRQQQDGEQNQQQAAEQDQKSMDGQNAQDQQSAEEQQQEQSGLDKQQQAARQTDGQESEEKAAEEQQARGVQEVAGELSDEERQSLEQWLRQVPDDPGGLLRRKFEYESQRNRSGNAPRNSKKIW